MTADLPGSGELDYLSFVDYAVRRMTVEQPGIDATAMHLGLILHRLTSTLVYDWESTVHRPHGWSWSGFRLLFVLWLVGPVEAKRAADLSGMSRAAVSALAKTLHRDGLLDRAPGTNDRRAVMLSLTDQGRRSLQRAYLDHNARERAWAQELTPEERRQLITLLEKLASSAAASDAKRRV